MKWALAFATARVLAEKSSFRVYFMLLLVHFVFWFWAIITETIKNMEVFP